MFNVQSRAGQVQSAHCELEMQGDIPARIQRRGALRSYDMYTKWGYFERRMSMRHQEQPNQDSVRSLKSATEQSTTTLYTPSAAPWKFFENVPDELSSLRTTEALAVAERHMRYIPATQPHS